MKKDPLQKFIKNIQQIWRPTDSNHITKAQILFKELLTDPDFKIENIHEKHELYRDPAHGFMLLAYTEEKDLYRPPHDHGDGWVLYGVKHGEIEMGSYESNLILRNKEHLKKGDARVYLPGVIHDTKCLSDSVLMLRFTSCDLEQEYKQGRMKKYAKPKK